MGIIIFLLGFFKSGRLKSLRRKYWNTLSWILIFVLLIQTLNCFILYHASTFESKYFNAKDNYGFEELANLREHIVGKLNSLSTQFERNSNGEIIYNGDMYSECIKSMKNLGKNIQAFQDIIHSLRKILFFQFYEPAVFIRNIFSIYT